MDAQQFCYWLQGFSELNNGVPPNDMQWKAIRDHLALVFNKVTPTYPGLGPDWQKEIIKDWKKYEDKNGPAFINNPPTWVQPVPNTPYPGYQVICSAGTTTNTQSVSIC